MQPVASSPERLAVDPERDGVEAAAFCLACSSAIRASRAPLMRCAMSVSVARWLSGDKAHLETLEHGCGNYAMTVLKIR